LDLVLNSIAHLELKDGDAAETLRSLQPVPESMDRDRVLTLLKELEEFLKEDDFRVAKTFEDLKEALAPGVAENELADLEKHIEGYAFEEALETLAQVSETLDDSLGGDRNV